MDEIFDLEALEFQNMKKVTDYIDGLEIIQHYEPTAHLGGQNSYFREEKHSSFSIFSRDGKIYWKDHGTGDSGDVFGFVQRWYKKNQNIELSFPEVNRAIGLDMKLGERQIMNRELFVGTDGPKILDRAPKGPTIIQIEDKGWTNWAYDYWISRYQITPNILEPYHVGHAKEVWVTPPGKPTYLWGVSIKESPIFYFYFPISQHVKVYAPFARTKNKKWIMNCDNNTDIQGYHQMNIKVRRPDLVIFTKAMKEVMFYRSFHFDALAIHGENHYFTQDFIRHIKKYSKHQLFVLDADEAGIRAAIKMKEMYDIPHYFIREEKNITDLWEVNPRLVEPYLTEFKQYT